MEKLNDRDPNLTFFEFKKNALTDAAYRIEARKKRNVAAGGPVAIWLIVLFCLFYCWVASYVIYHELNYEDILDGWVGFLLLVLALLPAYWLLIKIRKRNRFDLDKAVWESVWEAYTRETSGGKKGFDFDFEKSLWEKYLPVSGICRLLVAGDQVSDGYKSVFLSAKNRLVLADAWDGEEDGHAVVEIPVENITGLHLSQIKLKVRPRQPGGKKRTRKESIVVLAYSDTDNTIRHLDFYNMKDTLRLYDLLPHHLFNRSSVGKWFDRFLEV
jgi:hypothetical protein